MLEALSRHAQTLALLLLAALLFFWAVGAHQRLVRLRRRVVQAATRVAVGLDERSTAHAGLQAVLQRPLAAEHGALAALAQAHGAALAAAKAWAAKPFDSAAAQQALAADRPLASGAARVLALLEQHPELNQDEAVAQQRAAWQGAQERLLRLRQSFNDTAAEHDRALQQFPTRLLKRVFRFTVAGRV